MLLKYIKRPPKQVKPIEIVLKSHSPVHVGSVTYILSSSESYTCTFQHFMHFEFKNPQKTYPKPSFVKGNTTTESS